MRHACTEKGGSQRNQGERGSQRNQACPKWVPKDRMFSIRWLVVRGDRLGALFTKPGTPLAVKATVVGLRTKHPEKCERKVHKICRAPFFNWIKDDPIVTLSRRGSL
jgi:hypothetical protein